MSSAVGLVTVAERTISLDLAVVAADESDTFKELGDGAARATAASARRRSDLKAIGDT